MAMAIASQGKSALLILLVILSTAFGRNLDPIGTDERVELTGFTGEEKVEISNGTTVVPVTTALDDAHDIDVEDRIGLTVNRGQAHAVGIHGGHSGAQAMSYKYQVGILRPGQHYQSLVDRTGGYANSFAEGVGAPKTWAQAHSGGRPGSIGGGSFSGFQGGIGKASATSYTTVKKIVLNPFDGTVLYSNFHNSTQDHLESDSKMQENSTVEISNDEAVKQSRKLILLL